MPKPTQAVVGFMFSPDRRRVALIRKNRPWFHQGLLNGIGGKIELNDLRAVNALIREFWEETGVRTHADDWDQFAYLNASGQWHVYYYRTFSPLIYQVRSLTDEAVGIYALTDLDHKETTPNLPWMLAMALNPHIISAIVHDNEVKFPPSNPANIR